MVTVFAFSDKAALKAFVEIPHPDNRQNGHHLLIHDKQVVPLGFCKQDTRSLGNIHLDHIGEKFRAFADHFTVQNISAFVVFDKCLLGEQVHVNVIDTNRTRFFHGGHKTVKHRLDNKHFFFITANQVVIK